MIVRNIGIVGYGSIGQKHHQILKSMNDDLQFFIQTKQDDVKSSFKTLEEFSTLDLDYIIISNPTSMHYETLKFLDGHFSNINFLIEKPLFETFQPFQSQSNSYYVGYNLRFHSIISDMIELIKGKRIISIAIKTYSYLPHWRKNIDYQSSASALKTKGGGVLRDLSHEIDLLNYLFGNLQFNYADSRKISNLEIETDDYLLTCGQLECGAPFSMELNYFSRFNSRELFIETEEESIKLDIKNFTLTIIGKTESVAEYDNNINSSYQNMHQAVMSNNVKNACTLMQGMLVLQQIDQLESLSSS